MTNYDSYKIRLWGHASVSLTPYLYSKYHSWIHAEIRDLLFVPLLRNKELETISHNMVALIVKRCERNENYEPPFPPVDHPCFPHWLPEGYNHPVHGWMLRAEIRVVWY